MRGGQKKIMPFAYCWNLLKQQQPELFNFDKAPVQPYPQPTLGTQQPVMTPRGAVVAAEGRLNGSAAARKNLFEGSSSTIQWNSRYAEKRSRGNVRGTLMTDRITAGVILGRNGRVFSPANLRTGKSFA
jgi:hypothetical protein